MLKNFVIVKHFEGNGKFLFYVPYEVSLLAGDRVVCDTSRGADQLGVCCCHSFLADPEVVMPLFGTCEKNMRSVTGKFEYISFAGAANKKEKEDGKDG